MSDLREIPGGRQGAVLVKIRARFACDEQTATRLVPLLSSDEAGVEYCDGEARVNLERRVDGPVGGAAETARREVTLLQRRAQHIGIGYEEILEVSVNAERLVWDGERWRQQGEPVL